MPSLGADMESATLTEWMVKPGDTVTRGDIVAAVETSKGIIDIEIFDSGRIEQLIVQPGTEVPVGAVLAVYAPAGGESAAAPPLTPAMRAAAPHKARAAPTLREPPSDPAREAHARSRRMRTSTVFGSTGGSRRVARSTSGSRSGCGEAASSRRAGRGQ